MEQISDEIILDNDTPICAISTPSGRGGIAVARLSGRGVIDIFSKVWKGVSPTKWASHTAHFGSVFLPDASTLDEGVATLFKAPHSYTGQDVIEISVHGSLYIQQQLITTLCAAGCRLAQPGEFTRRAFLNQRLDLAEAEAVADIIAADSEAAHNLAVSQLKGGFSKHINELKDKLIHIASLLELELDFSEEDVVFADRKHLRSLTEEILSLVTIMAESFHTGQLIRSGIPVAIVGAVNVGKSSLLNAILHDDRAIVSDIPGTTRDTIEDTIVHNGITLRFIDTAGMRQNAGTIEQIGIQRAIEKANAARVIIHLIAPNIADEELTRITNTDAIRLTVLNKIDTIQNAAEIKADLKISAKQGIGISALLDKISDIVTSSMPDDQSLIVANQRHYQALTLAADELTNLLNALDANYPTDLLAHHLRQAINHLSSITGAITSNTILNTIFSSFCIGK